VWHGRTQPPGGPPFAVIFEEKTSVANIYVIDDDDQLLRMVGLMLERAGHSATLINSPSQGVERIKKEMPDLLVLDVMMPGMSGHDVCRQIRGTPEIADLPILVLTARAQDVDRVAALKSGADDYLSKPVTSHELIEKVDNLLSRQEGGQVDSRSGLIVSIFGMRGGAGRTTVAVNLAAALRRASDQDVCLVDLSPSGEQVTLHLRLQAQNAWDKLPANGGFSWKEVESILSVHQSGLRVLAAPALPQSPIKPPSATVETMLELLREKNLFTVVDLPPVLSPAVTACLAASDVVLHIVTPEVTSVQSAVQTGRALVKAGITLKQRSYLLNHILPESHLPQATVERALNSRVAFQIGYDSHQPRALAQGVPLALTPAQSPLAVVVRRMAEAMWQRVKQ
jgi:DNA-binding response OmpR family regulator